MANGPEVRGSILIFLETGSSPWTSLEAGPSRLFGRPEEYVDGICSVHLRRGRSFRGCGVYATSQRIIGVRSRRALVVTGLIYVPLALFTFLSLLFERDPFVVFPLLAFIAVGGWWIPTFSEWTLRGQKPRTIDELDSAKKFEVKRNEILRVEMKNPTEGGPGYASFVRRDGSEERVVVMNRRAYQRLRIIIQEFSSVAPQVSIREQF